MKLILGNTQLCPTKSIDLISAEQSEEHPNHQLQRHIKPPIREGFPEPAGFQAPARKPEPPSRKCSPILSIFCSEEPIPNPRDSEHSFIQPVGQFGATNSQF